MRIPSDRQFKAIALKAQNPAMSKKEAALLAGFRPSTAHNATKNIFAKPMIQTWIENYRYTIEKAGLTQDRVAKKLNELLEAKHQIRNKKGEVIAVVPNQKLQLETIKTYHDIFGIKDSDKNNEGVKRRITLEEFEKKEGM